MADPVSLAITTVAQVGISYLFPSQGPRIKDMKMSAASYGVAIPVTFGDCRVAGNVIWADKVVEHKKKKKVSKARYSIYYTYTQSFAVAFAAGPITEFRRIWADGKLIYDATGASAVQNQSKYTFSFYTGTEDQLPNSLIQSILGEDNTPAFRGLAYVVFDNFPLTDFSNKLPQLSAEVYTAGDGFQIGDESTSLSHIVGSLLEQGGLLPSQYDLAGLYGVKVKGYGFARGTDIKSVIEELQRVYMFELVEIEGKVVGNFRGGVILSSDSFTGGSYQDGSLYQAASCVVSIGLEKAENYIVFGGFSDGTPNDHLSIYKDNVKVYQIENPDGVGTMDIQFTVNGAAWDEADVGLLIHFQTASGHWMCKWSRATNSVTWTRRIPQDFGVFGKLTTGELCCAVDEYRAIDNLWMRIYILDTKTGEWKYRDGTPADEATYHGIAVPGSISNTTFGNDTQYYDSTRDKIITLGATFSGPPSIITVGNATTPPSGKVMTSPDGSGFGEYQTGTLTYDWVRGRIYVVYIDDNGKNAIKRVRVTDGGIDRYITSSDIGDFYRICSVLDSTGALVLFDALANSTSVRLINAESLNTYAIDGSTNNLGFDSYNPNGGGYGNNSLGSDTNGYEYILFRSVLGDFYYIYIARTAGSGTGIIPQDALGPVSQGGSDFWNQTRVQEAELPARVSLGFINPDNDFQDCVAHATRVLQPIPAVYSNQQLDIALSLIMTSSDAKTQATQILYSQWAERTSHSTRLPWAYLYLDPNDSAIVKMNDGRTYNERIARMEFGADYTIETDTYSQDNGAYLIDSVVADGGTGGYPTPTIAEPVNLQPFIINTPLLRDVDDTNGSFSLYYSGMGRLATDTNPFAGGALYRGFNENDIDFVYGTDDEVTWGTVATATPTAQIGDFALDWKTKITIEPHSTEFELHSISDDELWAGGNACIIGGEIMMFRDAVENTNGTWTISNLLRGRRGTEYFVDAHEANENFVMLEENGIYGGGDTLDSRGQARYFAAVGEGNYLDTAQVVEVFYEPRDLMPYAPKDIRRSIIGDTITLTWSRRSRTGGEMVDSTGDVPLRETSEQYEVYILDNAFGGDLSRGNAPDSYLAMYTTTTPTVSFDATSVGVNPILDNLHVAIYQLSSVVGRGFPGTRTIEPWDDF